MSALHAPAITITSLLREGAPRTLADDVLDGLTRPFKELPPKHFYDARGSELFERITELPEYYPTGAERSILQARAGEIARRTRATELVELGSGAAEKTRVLLDALRDAGTLQRYVPFDVAESTLVASANELVAAYPGLAVDGIVGDFEEHLTGIGAATEGEARIIAFLGGTIGNFMPGSRRRFLRQIAALLGPDDHLLLGTDLVKDVAVLEAAYNDAAGVTAEFNLNVLRVLNRELGASFDEADFEHVAFFDGEREWIEMRLRARRALTVEIPALDLTVRFAEGEELRTEISAKFTRERVEADFAAVGLELDSWLTDDEDRFALSLARLT
jgi:L-histidine N-alpha-methyltransferase